MLRCKLAGWLHGRWSVNETMCLFDILSDDVLVCILVWGGLGSVVNAARIDHRMRRICNAQITTQSRKVAFLREKPFELGRKTCLELQFGKSKLMPWYQRCLRFDTLDISFKQIEDEGMKVFSSALRSGALASLEILYLGSNQIGDEGMKAFSTALSSGALASLQDLDLSVNQIGHEGMKAFSAALCSGSLASLEHLELQKNRIGDEGTKAFSSALSSGALASLVRLYLNANQIGDKGMKAFLSSGALGQLNVFCIEGNPAIGIDSVKLLSSSLSRWPKRSLSELRIDVGLVDEQLIQVCKYWVIDLNPESDQDDDESDVSNLYSE